MTHARMWVGTVVVGLLGVLGLSGSLEQGVGVAGADSAVKKVECDKGQTLTDALKKAKPGDTLQVTGTCHERVIITTDRLTLDGGGSAVLDGGGSGPTESEGVVTIDGAHGVTLTGFTVQNGPGEGILGQRGTAFAVQQTTAQHNAASGIAIADGSTADLTDCTIHGNGFGIDVFTSSSAILRGALTSSQNTGNGAEVNGQSMLELRGAQVQLNDNGGAGLVAGSGQVAIFGFSASQGSTLTANGNGDSGIIIGGSQLIISASGFFGSGANIITASNNGVAGILVGGAGFITSPFGTGKFVIENNATGLSFINGAGAVIRGGLSVQNNGTGVSADGAGTLTLVSIPPNPSAIENNGTDVDLKFGTRATVEGVTIGTITCDATVLSRGTTVCP